jgi:hypothetical protein
MSRGFWAVIAILYKSIVITQRSPRVRASQPHYGCSLFAPWRMGQRPHSLSTVRCRAFNKGPQRKRTGEHCARGVHGVYAGAGCRRYDSHPPITTSRTHVQSRLTPYTDDGTQRKPLEERPNKSCSSHLGGYPPCNRRVGRTYRLRSCADTSIEGNFANTARNLTSPSSGPAPR